MPKAAILRFGRIGLDDGDEMSLYGDMADQLTWKLVDDTAAELGANDEARRKWRQSGRGVPALWRINIVQRLSKRGVVVSFADFDRLPENPGRIAA